jgi:hypothetical protein
MSDEQMTDVDEGTYEPLPGLSEERLTELSRFLSAEIQRVVDNEERQQMFEGWNEYRRQREAKPRTKVKNTPWEGASNVVVPLTLANTNGMYAKAKNYLNARQPRVAGSSFNKAYKEHAEVAAEILNFLNNSPFHVNLPAKELDMLYDCVSLGNQIIEWEWVERKVRVRRGGTFVDKILKQGPELKVHKIENVLVRASAGTDIQRVPWIGFQHRLFGHELMAYGKQGYFDPEIVEVVLSSPETTEADTNQTREYERMGLSPSYESMYDSGKVYDLVKAYVWFDADEDGQLEDLIVWIEPDSGEILRIGYNPIGVRLITNLTYFPVPGQFYGTGVGKMSHDMQEEVDTFHNLRVDTQHLASSGGIIRRRGATLFNKNQKIKPGFEFEADSPRDDYVLWNFPDVTQSTLVGESQARQYVELAIGAAEAFFGRPDQTAKSGTSFSLQNLQAGRTDSIFESIAQSLVEGYNDLFQKELMLLLNYGEQVREMLEDFYDPETQATKIQVMQELLAWDPEDIPGKIKFSVHTTEIAKSEETKRQTAMLRFQVYTMVFDKMTQLIPALSQPELDEESRRLLVNGIVGYHDMLRETLELAGTENIDDALLDVELYRTLGRILDTESRKQSEQLRGMYDQQREAERYGLDTGLGGGGEAQPQDPDVYAQGPGVQEPAGPEQVGPV